MNRCQIVGTKRCRSGAASVPGRSGLRSDTSVLMVIGDAFGSSLSVGRRTGREAGRHGGSPVFCQVRRRDRHPCVPFSVAIAGGGAPLDAGPCREPDLRRGAAPFAARPALRDRASAASMNRPVRILSTLAIANANRPTQSVRRHQPPPARRSVLAVAQQGAKDVVGILVALRCTAIAGGTDPTRTGEASCLTVPNRGCSVLTMSSRAIVCGWANARSTLLMGPLGTPAAERTVSHASVVLLRNVSSRISTSSVALHAAREGGEPRVGGQFGTVERQRSPGCTT